MWEKFGFKDMSLWETFQYDFESYTEEDFKSASIHHQRKLRDYLRKYGVWVRKQQRYTIARSLYEVLLEEEPTSWTEAEITACEENEEFASYQISRLIDSDFGRKPRKFRALTPTSPTGPPPAATSPTSALSAPAPVNTPIYPTQPPGIGPTPAAYGMQRSGARPAAYTQLSVIRPSPAVHTQPSSTGPAHAVQIHPSTINPLAVITTTSTGYTQTSPLGPPAAATLSVPAPFVSSSVSPTPSGEAPVSTSSAPPIPAPVNASNIRISYLQQPPSYQHLFRRQTQDLYLQLTYNESCIFG